jgi:hypothetical protein
MLLLDVKGFVAQANAEIRAAEAAHLSRKVARQRLHRPIALIDSLIGDLEMLNLRGVRRVPLAYGPRLLQLRAMLVDVATAEQLGDLRTQVRPVTLMGGLYTVQEALFARTRPDVNSTSYRLGLPFLDRMNS